MCFSWVILLLSFPISRVENRRKIDDGGTNSVRERRFFSEVSYYHHREWDGTGQGVPTICVHAVFSAVYDADCVSGGNKKQNESLAQRSRN